MTAGAAQILLKTADLVPEGRAVLAGQGPLLYLAALQLARAGEPPLALLETTSPGNYVAAMRHLGSLWAGCRAAAKGLALIAGDLERSAHALRNSLGIFGAQDAHRLTLQLETQAHQDDYEEMDHIFAALVRGTAEIQAALAIHNLAQE